MAHFQRGRCRACGSRLDMETYLAVRTEGALEICADSPRCRVDLARSPYSYGYEDRDVRVRALVDEIRSSRPSREDVAAARVRRGLPSGGLYS